MQRGGPRYRPGHRRVHRPVKTIFWGRAEISPVFSCFVSIFIGFTIFLCFLSLFERKIQPVAEAAARSEISASVNAALEESLGRILAQNGAALVHPEYSVDGSITALTTDTDAMNKLRTRLVSDLGKHLQKLETSDLNIPLGSLFSSGAVRGYGPKIQVRSLSFGKVSARYRSEFSGAGLNQTRHRILLEVTVPVSVLLPGKLLEEQVESQILVGETVIVGRVPDIFPTNRIYLPNDS